MSGVGGGGGLPRREGVGPPGGSFAGSSERAVQATNDDATVSKLSCVQHGYFSDNFVRFFVRRPTRRSPVIHRGYFARWAALRVLVDQFLDLGEGGASVPPAVGAPTTSGAGSLAAATDEEHSTAAAATNSKGPIAAPTAKAAEGAVAAASSREGPNVGGGDGAPATAPAQNGAGPVGVREVRVLGNLQIISLGSGFDTLFFQLQDEGRIPGRFIEIDFPEVTSKKAGVVNSKPQLSSLLQDFRMAPEKCGFVSKHYILAAADLRDTDQLHSVLEAAGADFSAPTLLLAECVLIYMDPSSSDKLVAWVAKIFTAAAFVVYEQIHPDDSFGQQMIQNLEARGCPLLSLHHTPTLEAKEERFLKNGFDEAEAVDMDTIYSKCIDVELKKRIEGLEIFDEFEEWHLMQEHYCIAYGIKSQDRALFKNFGYNLRRRSLERET